MYLKHIEISGFRGINHLSLQLRPNMVLIGENAWGKSSLIDALSLIFNLEHKLYQFQFKDFHIQYSDTPSQVRDITLIFTFVKKLPMTHCFNFLQHYRFVHFILRTSAAFP